MNLSDKPKKLQLKHDAIITLKMRPTDPKQNSYPTVLQYLQTD